MRLPWRNTISSCDLFPYGFFKTSEENIFGGGNKTNNYVLLQEAQQDLLKQAGNTKIHDQATLSTLSKPISSINPELTYDKLLRQKYAEFLIFFVSEDLLIVRKDQEEESLKLLTTYGDSFNAFKTMFLERKSEALLQNNTLNYNGGDVLRFLCLSEDKELKAKTMKKFMMEFFHIRKIKTLGTDLEYSKTLQDEIIKAMCLKFKPKEFNKFSDDYSKLITILDEMNLPSDGNLHSEFPKFLNQVLVDDSISDEFKERIATRTNDSWDLKYELKNYFKDPKIMKLDIQQLILDMKDRKSDFRSNTSERMKHLKDYLKTRPDMKISFKEFMNESLFGSHGYYSENDMTSSENKLIGTGGLNKGDFSTFTSSQPFCKMVAQEYFAFKQKNPNSVLVLGSDGVGSLRNNLQKLGVEPNEIFTIDISPTLLKEQMKLSQSLGGENSEGNFIEGSAFDKASFDKIRQQFSVDNEPAIFIMANELMDVQPMDYFTLKINDDNSCQVKELYIRLDKMIKLSLSL